MDEYIDRKALIEHLEKDPLYDLVEQYGVTEVIESFPAADVQPVVRCNECNLYDGVHKVHGIAPCIYWMHMTVWDDYCSHGVRRDGEDNG